jgi:hypothetical protein
MVDYDLCWKCNKGLLDQNFTYSWVRESKMSTSNIAKQKHAWGCKGKHGWLFFIQRIFINIQELNSRWHHKMQLTTINSRQTWVTCYTKNNQTSTRSWIGHGYITLSHFSCFITLDENCFKPFKKKGGTMHWLETIIINQTNEHL